MLAGPTGTRWPAPLWSLVDRLVPAALAGTEDERRARVLIGLVVVVLVTTPLNLLTADGLSQVLAILGVSGMFCVPILVMRRSGSAYRGGVAYGITALAGSLLALTARGYDSSSAVYVMTPPLVVTLVAGPRAGVVLAGVSIAVASVMTYLQSSGVVPAGFPSTVYQQIQPYVVGGAYAAFVSIYSESTARRALREAKQLNEELTEARDRARRVAEARSRFLATMSHELRTPLNGVVGSVQLMRTPGLDPELADHVETLEVSAAALMAVVNDVLDLSKIEAGRLSTQLQPTELRKALSDVVRLGKTQLQGRPVELSFDVDDEVAPWIRSDPMRLGQILRNLVNNAIKFTERGRIELCAVVEGTSLRIEVRDTGLGIPPDRIGQVFEPFRQADETHERRFGGTGLGLPISRRLARLLGGDLTVRSEPGRGSTFILVHPYESCPDEAPSVDHAEAEVVLEGVRVLVVDDHPINRKVASALLRRLGVDSETADDGRQAVAKWKADPHFDAILMDWEMPDLGGGDATAQIRLLPGGDRVPVIAVSAHVMDDFRQTCIDAGLDDCLPKPLEKARLIAALQHWVGPSSVRLRTGSGEPLSERLAGLPPRTAAVEMEPTHRHR